LHDPLTTLPNRRFLDKLLSSSPAPSGNRLALIHIDLDGFKEINDTRGHAAGDDVLRITASRLRGAIGPKDTAVRIGGDEFVVACRNPDPEVGTILLARRIIHALSAPLLIDGTECRVGASAGVAWERDEGDACQLLKNADLALYEAKQAGRGRAKVFTEKLRIAAENTKLQAEEFTRALDNDEIVAYFQPQFDAATFELAGVEALARWDHPQQGILTPDRFLAVAEITGRTGDLDKSILRKALFELTRWDLMGVTIPRISVNISARRLADKNLLSELSGLPLLPGRLCFELLETVYFDGQDSHLREVIGQIKARGIDIEIDDFGTGHASILGLLQLQPKRLKIDRQFIMPIVTSIAQRRLVSSIIDIGRSQNVEVVAEGVETLEHAKILRDLGCHLLQGYAFARPMSSNRFVTFIRERSSSHATPAATAEMLRS
jgi:diguanylate cyclase (GGDEF)-like protein